MDLDQNFTTTRLGSRDIFSFSLTILLVDGIVVLTSIASVAHGQLGDTKAGVFNHTQTDYSGTSTWTNSGNWSMTG